MENELVKKYQKENLTVVWKPKTCIHAAVCVKKLPNVYNPKERPWMKLENASVEELKAQIDACPSGALSYEEEGVEKERNSGISVKVSPNGPLIIEGDVEITLSNGNTETKEKMAALCRCGHSSNKPYCDGAHAKHDFKG